MTLRIQGMVPCVIRVYHTGLVRDAYGKSLELSTAGIDSAAIVAADKEYQAATSALNMHEEGCKVCQKNKVK